MSRCGGSHRSGCRWLRDGRRRRRRFYRRLIADVGSFRFVASWSTTPAAATTATTTAAALAAFAAFAVFTPTSAAAATTTTTTALARFATTNDWWLWRLGLRGRGNNEIATWAEIRIHFNDTDLGNVGNATRRGAMAAAARTAPEAGTAHRNTRSRG